MSLILVGISQIVNVWAIFLPGADLSNEPSNTAQ